MASKAAIVNGEERPSPVKRQGTNPASKFVDGVVGHWHEFTQFLNDVRSEMRKVVAPSWKEVKSTTAVVIIAVFIFGVFFFVVDYVFSHAMGTLMHKMGG